MNSFFDSYIVINLFCLLDELDEFQIEEAKDLEDDIITLEQLKAVNSGNNCLHYIFKKNSNRLVIQTYKDMDRKGKVDVVQGIPGASAAFKDILNYLNAYPEFTDDIINRCFVLYKWYWGHCDGVYKGSGRDILCTFFMSDCWLRDGKDWSANLPAKSATNDQVLYFIKSMDESIHEANK